MNVNPVFLPAALVAPAVDGGAAAPGGPSALAARDAAMPDLAATTASTNSLQALAGLLGSSSSSSAASASSVAAPAPPLPSTVDHGSHDERPVNEDLGLDDPGANPSQASISA